MAGRITQDVVKVAYVPGDQKARVSQEVLLVARPNGEALPSVPKRSFVVITA